jgi:hypothetical protein
MLTLSQAARENSDISGALFASTTINAFFNVQKFKVKVNPSLFYSLFYLTASPKSSGLVYTLDYKKDGTVLYADYDILMYSGFLLEGSYDLTAKPGVDISLGLEYPLAKEIGLTNALLDFDISLNLINVPLVPSKMEDYTRYYGQIGSRDPIKFLNNDEEGDNFLSSFDSDGDSETGKKEIGVYRPFKMLISADWHPLSGSRLLTVTPVIGFCHNDLYYEPFSLEFGIKAGLNLANFFLAKIGFNYTDRMFVNSIGLGLNLRAFEVDIGGDLRSQNAAQSWVGAGFSVNVGLKFGW